MLIFMIYMTFMISLILMFINMLISKKEFLDREKLSTFECGFTPFSSSRLPFSINFFIIGILFLIFDVEVVFLFPMINLLKFLMFYEFLFVSVMIMILLYLGLEFEKNEGNLKWNF